MYGSQNNAHVVHQGGATLTSQEAMTVVLAAVRKRVGEAVLACARVVVVS